MSHPTLTIPQDFCLSDAAFVLLTALHSDPIHLSNMTADQKHTALELIGAGYAEAGCFPDNNGNSVTFIDNTRAGLAVIEAALSAAGR